MAPYLTSSHKKKEMRTFDLHVSSLGHLDSRGLLRQMGLQIYGPGADSDSVLLPSVFPSKKKSAQVYSPKKNCTRVHGIRKLNKQTRARSYTATVHPSFLLTKTCTAQKITKKNPFFICSSMPLPLPIQFNTAIHQ